MNCEQLIGNDKDPPLAYAPPELVVEEEYALPSVEDRGKEKLMQLIAGLTLEQAVLHAKDLYEREHVRGLINIAGEHYREAFLVEEATEAYIELLRLIHAHRAPCSISIKPTQIGQKISKQVFYENLEKIVTEAGRLGLSVELDMETLDTMDDTVEVFCAVAIHHCGILLRLALQADVTSIAVAKRIAATGAGVRLVKGCAYGPTSQMSLVDIHNNFVEIAKVVPPSKLAIATGNRELIKRVQDAVGDHGDIAYQFLLGLPYHEELYRDLVAKGSKVSLYMPCGDWSKVRDYVGRRHYLTSEEYHALDAKYL